MRRNRWQHTYILPNGYKVEMVKKGDNSVFRAKKAGTTAANQYTKWHLKGTVAEGSFLHKPATVSGGGKSEISKRIEVTHSSACMCVCMCLGSFSHNPATVS
jgi:hypothetical protein